MVFYSNMVSYKGIVNLYIYTCKVVKFRDFVLKSVCMYNNRKRSRYKLLLLASEAVAPYLLYEKSILVPPISFYSHDQSNCQ